MKGTVYIPKSQLSKRISATREYQNRAIELLRELEEKFLDNKVNKIGGWRQDTKLWLRSKD